MLAAANGYRSSSPEVRLEEARDTAIIPTDGHLQTQAINTPFYTKGQDRDVTLSLYLMTC